MKDFEGRKWQARALECRTLVTNERSRGAEVPDPQVQKTINEHLHSLASAHHSSSPSSSIDKAESDTLSS
jgi:hypothetical protein